MPPFGGSPASRSGVWHLTADNAAHHAAGTPIVATTVGSIPEVVGDAGLLVPAMDSRALADAVRDLLANELLRHDLGARGVERARGIYRQEKMVARTLEVYESFLKRH